MLYIDNKMECYSHEGGCNVCVLRSYQSMFVFGIVVLYTIATCVEEEIWYNNLLLLMGI